MENYGIFGQLATEAKKEVEPAVEANVLEEIGAEEAYADALSIEASIEADLGAMAQATVAADRIEAQVAHEELLLATPEKINVGCVALSQEALSTTAMLLGAPADALAAAVSLEAAESNPVSAMQVSQEGAKDFLKKVIESIKAIFRKVMNSAKKLYVKLVVAMDGTSKSAIKLKKYILKDLKDAKAKEANFSDKVAKKLRTIVYTNSITGLSAVDTEIATAAISKIMDAQIAADKDMDAISEDLDAAALTAAEDGVRKTFNENVNKLIKGLVILDTSVAEDNFSYTAPSDSVKLFVTSHSGTKVRVLELNTADDKSTVKVKTLTMDASNVGDSKYPVPVSAKDTTIITSLDSVIEKSKKFGKTKDIAMKAIEQANKVLDKLAKTKGGDTKIGYMKNKFAAGNATLLRDLTVTALLNSVLDEVKLTKAKLSVVKIKVSEFSNTAAAM